MKIKAKKPSKHRVLYVNSGYSQSEDSLSIAVYLHYGLSVVCWGADNSSKVLRSCGENKTTKGGFADPLVG